MNVSCCFRSSAVAAALLARAPPPPPLPRAFRVISILSRGSSISLAQKLFANNRRPPRSFTRRQRFSRICPSETTDPRPPESIAAPDGVDLRCGRKRGRERQPLTADVRNRHLYLRCYTRRRHGLLSFALGDGLGKSPIFRSRHSLRQTSEFDRI